MPLTSGLDLSTERRMKRSRVSMYRLALLFLFSAGGFLLVFVVGSANVAEGKLLEFTPASQVLADTQPPKSENIPTVCETLLSEGFESSNLGQFTNSVTVCMG